MAESHVLPLYAGATMATSLASFTQERLEARRKELATDAGGGDGLPVEVVQQLGELLQVGEEALDEGEQAVGAGACQQEGHQGRVRHGGVLSRGVWSAVANPRFLGKTPPFKQNPQRRRTS